MAVEIPKESRVYTTVYETFKGVDFTNDASNVFYRRSPTGKNMLPDIDGRPYKRSGWKVEIPESRFREIYEEETHTTLEANVVPDRVYYFELDGKDYLMIFNNLGLFSYSEDGLVMVATAADLDSKKAFFFEGGGDAGFYFFRGHTLYKYVGEAVQYSHAPKVPVFLIGCDSSGTGTVYEPINMLTRKRTVQYLCDGTSSTFDIPGGVGQDGEENYLIHSVQLRNSQTGQFEDYAYYKIVSDGTQISFFTNSSLTTAYPPPVVVEGEDNMRITYEPDDSGSYDVDYGVLTGWKTVSVTKTTTRTDTGQSKTSYMSKTNIAWSATSADFNLDNLIKNADGTLSYIVQCRNSEGTDWQEADSTYTSNSWNAYSGQITIKGKKALFNSDVHTYTTKTTTDTSSWVKSGSTYKRTVTKKETKTYRIRVEYDRLVYESSDTDTDDATNAFFGTTRAMIFGNGIINQVFLTASTSQDFNTRVWYSAATDPSYFPDTNYFEVGSTDKPIMGLIRVGEYLGIIKQGSGTETSVYLAYPTSFENETTYAVKQSVNGIGAIANGAFNILNDEPLFLSAEGVMGIEPSEDESRKIRNRSHYINKRLCAEDNLASAISFVHDGMYWLAVNNHCYVLDGSQKSSWANTKTNLQYECYYLENIPAQCFAKMGGQLWFTDFDGNLCRFKDETDENQYSDDCSSKYGFEYNFNPDSDGRVRKDLIKQLVDIYEEVDSGKVTAEKMQELYDEGAMLEYVEGYVATGNDVVFEVEENGEVIFQSSVLFNIGGPADVTNIHIESMQQVFLDALEIARRNARYRFYFDATDILGCWDNVKGDVIRIIPQDKGYIVMENDPDDDYVIVSAGSPIEAVWGTIADDDGAPHYFKNLQKKGCMVVLLPSSDSGVEVWLKADDKEPVKIGETDAKNYELPFDYYIKKKVKKYKRLQIICKNNVVGDSFGVDQIIKSYTFGNYSKNRG